MVHRKWKLIFSKGKHKIPSATERRAGSKAGGCLRNEQDALGELMIEQHPTHFLDRWCQFVSCSSHKKCYYVVSDNSVFPWWSWQWALLLTTNQQSPWCLGKRPWFGGNSEVPSQTQCTTQTPTPEPYSFTACKGHPAFAHWAHYLLMLPIQLNSSNS